MANKVQVIDKGWNKIVAQMSKYAKGKTASIGIQGPAASVDRGDGFTNADIGAVHEFGSQDGRIPERSHFRSTAKEQETKVQKQLVKLAVDKVFAGKSADSELRMIGEEFKGAIVSKIKGGIAPPLKHPRASGKEGPPLWDTGQYINALSVEVVNLEDKQ